MSNQVVQVPVDSTGKKIDVEELIVGANTVERQRIEVAGAVDLEIARVQNITPVGTEYGLVTRNIPSGTQPVNGTITANLGAGENHVGWVGGGLVVVSASFTRPADAIAYAALDAVADSTTAPTVRTFANAARVTGGSGYITRVRLMTDQKTNTARFRLHLFQTAPTAINDNAPYTLLWATRTTRLGSITLSAAGTEDPTNSTAAEALDIVDRLPFVCAAADTNLYGLLETLDVFTPTSGQNFYVDLTIDQN